jgi:twitching motility protein PilT
MIDHINKTRACHILTIEDPTEFVHEPLRAQITQREIGIHTSSGAAALRAAGRDNADVVLVSDLRTNEEIRLALQLACNGVLVFATTYTNGATATIDRLVSAFSAEEQPRIRGAIAESLAGIVSQQLMRTSDNKARVAVHEILIGGHSVSALIREGKTAQLAGTMQAGQALGMQTLDMALERLVTGNRIAAEAALERAVDKEAFAQVIARVRPDLAELLG